MIKGSWSLVAGGEYATSRRKVSPPTYAYNLLQTKELASMRFGEKWLQILVPSYAYARAEGGGERGGWGVRGVGGHPSSMILCASRRGVGSWASLLCCRCKGLSVDKGGRYCHAPARRHVLSN